LFDHSLLNALIFNSLLVALAVVIHYEALHYLPKIINRFSVRHRVRLVFGVFGALCAHVVEMWLFGFGYFLFIPYEIFGSLTNNATGELITSLEDCAYFSFTTYTSVGYGDITPSGWLRFLAGLEALTGLVLITWTASYLFIEMQRLWKVEESKVEENKDNLSEL